MHTQTLEMIAIAVAVIVLVTVRQSMWQPVDLGRQLRLPIIFAVLGVFSLATSVKVLGPGWHLGLLDVVIIGAELAFGVVAGWLMGRFTRIQRFGEVLKSRLAPAGVAIWIGFLLVRIGLAVVAHVFDAGLAAQSGTIMLVLAVIKAVQALMVRERVERHQVNEERSLVSVDR